MLKMTIANEIFTSNTTPSTNQTLFNAVIGATKTIPIIFLPGIMGSNLVNEQGKEVWFPPNTVGSKISTLLGKIFNSSPASRQIDLNPLTTRVDNGGYIKINKTLLPDFSEELARSRGWGTIYWDGYGKMLMFLESYLNKNLTTLMNFHSLTDKEPFLGGEPWRAFTDILQKEGFTMVGVEPTTPIDKKNEITKVWNPTKSFELLSIDEFKNIANYNFPVFGLGYNWLKSNDENAEDVIKRLDSLVQPQIKKEFPKAPFEKYIIITHSMGGLVARSMILNAGLKSKTLGIVHGVMPAAGAPTVYKRFGNGWDGNEVTGKLEDYFAQVIFGATATSITPVLGNSPGALSLLPFSNFKNGSDTKWLTLRAKKLDGSPIEVRLPTDPEEVFDEIYMNTGSWWRMVNMDFLDPANIIMPSNAKTHTELGREQAGVAGAAIGSLAGSIANMIGESHETPSESDDFTSIEDFYYTNIRVVKRFQDLIKDSYLANTYAHYGNDVRFRAFHEVIWETEDRIDVQNEEELINYCGNDIDRTKKVTYDPTTGIHTIPTISINANWDSSLFHKNGERRIKRPKKSDVIFKLHVAPTVQGSGDGTVCHQSASDVCREHVKQVFVINGYDHANSYNNDQVQSNVLYSIGKILKELKSTKA